ncbi:hypothetical protein MRB53_021268 [Persea americana]|uniref:Uncharacterized protein n=1 Tax=Persea americana TaxID=3435 RepID=A0ACC2L3J2_PERAE|nr:hypothetical protein MRB53_021268 [Persea americana]
MLVNRRRWRRLPLAVIVAIANIRICCAVAVDGEEGLSAVDEEDPDCSTVVYKPVPAQRTQNFCYYRVGEEDQRNRRGRRQ